MINKQIFYLFIYLKNIYKISFLIHLYHIFNLNSGYILIPSSLQLPCITLPYHRSSYSTKSNNHTRQITLFCYHQMFDDPNAVAVIIIIVVVIVVDVIVIVIIHK